jgi:hypothetical protein
MSIILAGQRPGQGKSMLETRKYKKKPIIEKKKEKKKKRYTVCKYPKKKTTPIKHQNTSTPY